MAKTPSIASRLRTLRESAGLSIQQLAERAGISRQAVQHLETGKRTNPAIDTVRKLAKALGKSLAEFD